MNDSNLQQTLLNAAVNPPENVWEKIAMELDEQKADEPLRTLAVAMEAEAPAEAWLQIEPVLDDLAVQKKILSVEESVPPALWNAIDAQLSVDAFDELVAAKLQQTEVTPPPSNWHAIEQQLQESEPAKIISINKNNTRLIRIAVAAAVTGIVAFGGYRLLNNNMETESASLAAVSTTPAQPSTATAPATNDSNTIAAGETPDTEEVRRAAIKERIKQKSLLNDAVAYVETPEHNLQNTVAYQGIHHTAADANINTTGFAENQYYMVLNESGELVRVSKKINNLKCAVTNGSTQIDATTALQSKECNEQIKKWQEKMAIAAAISASAGDIDLNELVNSTQQQ